MSDFSLRGQGRRIAYHEAGHAVVGRHFGLRIALAYVVQKTIYRPDGSSFKHWEGEVRAPFNWLTSHQQRVVGVAGPVALCCWEAYRDHEDNDVPFLDAVADRMSDGDWTINGVQVNLDPEYEEQPWIDAIKEAHALLNHETGPLWCELKRDANRMVGGYCILDPLTSEAA